MNMACPCCTVGGKINTLDSIVVTLNSTKGKSQRSAASVARRTKIATENRLLAKFELCKPRDTNTQRKVSSSLSSRSHGKGSCNMKSMQQQASNDSSHCRTSSSQSKVSAKPKTCERKTLAFVLHEKDASEEVVNTNSSYKHSVVFKNDKPEFADREVSSLHPSLPLCREVLSDNMNQKHSRMHVGSNGLPDYLFHSGGQNDHDESEESEREIENAICLSSFTFGSKSQSLPLFESGKKALVRQLSSESCISMLSLDCTDDQLSARGCIEPFSSADLCTQEEMTKFSVCFPETRNILGDEANIVEPCFEFGLSGRPHIQPVSNLRMESEKMKSSNIDLPPRKGMSKGKTLVINPEKDFQPHAKNKKRARSAINERHKMANRRTKKAFLNFQRCRGIAGHNGAALMDRAFNVGVGIGVSYMLFANWKEFKRLNDLLEKTQSFVQEMQQQAQCKNSPLLGCLSTLRTQASKNPQVKKDEQNENFQNADSKAKGEPLLRSINMTDLEAALEAELALMQQNLEGAEPQGSPRDVDEWNPKVQSSIVDDLLRKCDHDKTPRHSSTNGCVLNVHQAVSPNALNKRLHEVLEAQQEKRIMNLEAQIEAREIELMMKEKELQCWKDIAHHLVKAYRDKPEQTETRTTKDKGILFSNDYDLKAPQNSLSVTKDGKKHFLVKYLRQQYEDSKSIDSVAATSCFSGGVRTNQLSARPDFLCNDIRSTLIDPSFEALISRNTVDWPLEDFQTHSTVSAWKEESDFAVLSDIARKCSNESWADQDVCDLLKGLDADKMFPWLFFEEEHLEKFSHLGESSAISNNSLQVNKDYYCLSPAKT